MTQEKTEGMLSPYRVLDLTDEKGLLCGKLLGDLGADVIKVERPGGDPSRNLGPFYHDEVDPEKVNPGIILVSITPFGQTGPYKDYKAPDIVAWAMGGEMYRWGDTDRPPMRMS